MNTLITRQLEALERLRSNFLAYAPECLKIKDKKGNIVPFRLNKAQLYIHARLEGQRAQTGWVRALILKGRQQGASTYIGGRFYHKSSLSSGVSVYILTHEQAATDNLFNMVARYHQHTPLKPATGKSNAKELLFEKLDSGYGVATAGQKAAGRSRTTQLFHGSEVAFWPNDKDHFAASVQTVPLEPGTEVILESTGNGMLGEFYARWQDAEAGIGDYIAVFVPWFWEEGYTRPVPENFILNTDKPKDGLSEMEYYQIHGTTMGQMVWRRAKIRELGDEQLFMQEYPATADEAFQTTGHDSFIKSADVLRARKNNIDDVLGPLIVGVDPSRYGDDLFAISWRRGRKVFMDIGGLGGPIYDLVCSYGDQYAAVLEAVNFGDPPLMAEVLDDNGNRRPGPKNRRAEMYNNTRDWLTKTAGGVDLPDEGVIQSEACAATYRYDSNQNFLIESKDQMRKRGVRSPDRWDSIILTFAAPVRGKGSLAATGQRRYAPEGVDFSVPGGWMSL